MGLGTRRAGCQQQESIRIMTQPTLFPILPSEKPPKKPWLLGCSIVAALLSVGFFAGRGYQHMQNGYSCSILGEKSYPLGEGTIRLKYVSETVGWTFLDTEKSVIEYSSPSHSGATLYKAQRGFQESTPSAKNLQVEADTLR